jgi:hypothetical protein
MSHPIDLTIVIQAATRLGIEVHTAPGSCAAYLAECPNRCGILADGRYQVRTGTTWKASTRAVFICAGSNGLHVHCNNGCLPARVLNALGAPELIGATA